MVLLGVPLAVLAAGGLEHWRRRSPASARALFGLALTGGLCSGAVAVAVFQGPACHGPGRGNYQWAHAESMLASEAEVLAQLGRGVVLAPASEPPLYSDLAVNLREGVSTMLGQATLSLGDTRVLEMNTAIQRWFAPQAGEAERRAFVEQWCVDYVLCPEARPVDPATLEQLRSTSWLRETAVSGGASLFRVLREGGTS